MRDRMQALWDDVVPLGVACPQADPAAVKRRVNAALNAVPSERRTYMRQKIRFAAATAAVVGLLAGTALAAAGQWNVLDFYFEGDNTPADDYVNHETYSVSDDNYTLSVTSSVADTRSAYLLVTVEAKTDEARAALMADDFENISTFDLYTLSGDTANPEAALCGFGYGEDELLRTGSSRSYGMSTHEMGPAHALRLRAGFMEDGLYVDIPLTPVEPLSLEINAEGTSFGTTHNVKGGASLTLASISLSPLSLHMEYSYPAGGGEAEPLLLFRKTDGTLLSWGQVVGTSGGMFATGEEDSGTVFISADYRLRSVLDLSRLDAVVFNGMAYPLDGGAPEAVEVDPALYPFRIPLMEPLSETGGYGVPVRALCEGLGVACIWDNEAQTAAMTYRGVTIILTPGSTTALVNGQPVETEEAPAVQDGKLAAEHQIFTDAWQLAMSVAYDSWPPADGTQIVAWLVIP